MTACKAPIRVVRYGSAPSKLRTITGGTITNNYASESGGGLFLEEYGCWSSSGTVKFVAKATVSDGVSFYGNTADAKAGDDFYVNNYENEYPLTLTLPEVGDDWTLGTEKITGWYYDGAGDQTGDHRWNTELDDGTRYVKVCEPGAHHEKIALKAAYSAPALSVNIMCIDSIDKPSFIGDTFTVTAKASDSDAVINMNCNQTFVEQTGSQKNEDGSVTFTYKVIKAKPAWANMTFTATATKDGATSDPVSKSQAINLRVRLMVKVKESDGTVIDNAAVVLDYAYSNEPHNRDLTLNYDNEEKIYQPKPWDLSASGDYASVIITLPDGRMATISKDEDGNSVQSLIAAGESDVVVEYQFPAYQVTGKLFVNGKPAKYTSGASTNQYTKTISGVYNTVISYDEMTDWAENLVKTDLDAENAPTTLAYSVHCFAPPG